MGYDVMYNKAIHRCIYLICKALSKVQSRGVYIYIIYRYTNGYNYTTGTIKNSSKLYECIYMLMLYTLRQWH